MINSLQLWPYYRDTWGSWDSHVNPALASLDHNSCYWPKFYNAPDIGQQLMAPGAYLEYTLTITPGDVIVGFLQNVNLLPTFNGNVNVPQFAVQITDVSSGHKMFDTPISNIFLSNPDSTYPNLLPTPHPVSGSGLFRVQFWANKQNVGTQRIFLIFECAEVVRCL